MKSSAAQTPGKRAGVAVPTGLVYSDLLAPGIQRRRRGKGFSFHLDDGSGVAPAVAEWCRALAIPPAWREVWISLQRNGHILCTGLDDRGRRQYRYHPDWTTARNLVKFDGLMTFARRLYRIRDRVEIDLRAQRHSHRRMVAAVVRLIDEGLVRVGNDDYARTNGTYGASTLRERHVSLDGDRVAFAFTGKSGKARRIDLDDAELARTLHYAQELPGQRLFRYRDDAEQLRDVQSQDVNDYLQDASGLAISAKDFRTWGGTVAAWQHADAHRQSPPKRPELQAIKHAAGRLGNTAAVARTFYVHPLLVAAIEAGDVPPRARRSRKNMNIEETSVVRWLESL